ncbi:MAG: winged helix-turn-helix domain-containing protein [Acidimicrobiia bacterium]
MPDTSVFAALGDPTRRRIVDWLSEEGVGTATQFAGRLPITRQAVAKHLNELARAGIVTSSKSGRETRFSLQPALLVEASNWLEQRAAAWDRTLGRLKQHVED